MPVVWDDEQPAEPKHPPVWDEGGAPAKPQVGQGETFIRSAISAIPFAKPIADAASSLILRDIRRPQAQLTPQALAEAKARGIDVSNDPATSVADDYRAERADSAARAAAGAEQNPITSGAGKTVGTVASLLAPAGAAKVGTGFAGRVASGALTGAGYGGAYALSDSKADLTKGEFGQAAQDVVKGAGLGALVGGGASAMAPVVGWAAQKLSEGAEHVAVGRALKTAGAMLKNLRQLGYQGKVEDVADTLLNEGLVTPLATTADVAERSAAARGVAGKQVGDTLKAIDSAAQKKGLVVGFSPGLTADRIERELIAPMQQSPAHAAAGVPEYLQAHADQLRSSGGGRIQTLSEANKLKGRYDDFLNHTAEQSPQKEALKQMRGIINDEIEKRAVTVDPALAEQFTQAKNKYGLLSTIADMAKDKVQREAANSILSPTAKAAGMMALAGHIAHNGMSPGALASAAGSALLTKGAQMYGPALSANAAQLAGKTWGKVAQLLQNDPGQLGKFGPALAHAFSMEPERAAALHLQLAQTNPEYQQQLAQVVHP